MTNKLQKKALSILMVFILLMGFIPFRNIKANQEYFYVNNSHVNAHTGTVLVNTRVSKHGSLAHKVGDKIKGTTYYQVSSNGTLTGKPFICIEVGTQFSSYKTYGTNWSKYFRNGEYKNMFKGAKLYEYRDSVHQGQRLISYDYEKIEENDLEIWKESAEKNVSELAKSAYSLDGAKYGIYKTKENALKNINSWGVLSTVKSGRQIKLS